jgi:hypothetical protein
VLPGLVTHTNPSETESAEMDWTDRGTVRLTLAPSFAEPVGVSGRTVGVALVERCGAAVGEQAHANPPAIATTKRRVTCHLQTISVEPKADEALAR